MSNEDLKFGLDELEVGDDLDIAYNPDEYNDQANPAPPAAGNYRIKALSLTPRRDKEQKVVKEDDKYPIFVIGMAEIVEGLVDGNDQPITRKFGLFSDVKTKSFDRYGVPASGLNDLIRSYGLGAYRGLDEGILLLREAFDTGSAFTAQLDWSVYDKAFIDAALEQFDIPKNKLERSEEERKLNGAIYKAGRIQGMKYFPFSNGRFIPVYQRTNVKFTNPNTNQPLVVSVEHRSLEAKPVLTRYYSATEFDGGRVKLGPFNTKPQALKAA